MSTLAHYSALFANIEHEFGVADSHTLAAIIDFTAGGPVSVRRFGSPPVYLTCELSLNSNQKLSAQGLRFELMSRLSLSPSDTQKLLTVLGDLSLDATLGDRHTVDVSKVSPSPDIQKIRLSLFHACEIGGKTYGIYEVCNAA